MYTQSNEKTIRTIWTTIRTIWTTACKTLFYILPLQRSNTDSMYLFLDDVGENGRSGGESPNRHGEPKTKKLDMNINSLLSADANISVVIFVADLKEFALCVVTEAMAAKEAEKKEEKYLTPDDVADMVGVSKNTLWRWEKEKYLIPIKVGRKSRYKLSDVKSILEGRG